MVSMLIIFGMDSVHLQRASILTKVFDWLRITENPMTRNSLRKEEAGTIGLVLRSIIL